MPTFRAFKVCSRSGDAEMSAAVAQRMQEIVFDAAAPVQPGEKIKAQVNKAWANLSRPRFWRVVAAWKGEAGPWSAAACYDFEARYAAFKERRKRAAREADLTHAARLEAAATALENADGDFHSAEITRLRGLANSLRNLAGNRDLAGLTVARAHDEEDE